MSCTDCRAWGGFLLRSKKRWQGGFTLIEILIVAALISLLAGIAAINIQAMYLANQRKSTIGEIRQIITSLDFAYNDTMIYPKICFLNQNILYLAPPQATPYNRPGQYLVSGFDYMGFDVNSPSTITNRIIRNWANGTLSQGYFSMPQGKKGMFQYRRAGICRMEIPMDIYNPQILASGATLPIYEWPTDPWGNPYVLYMLYLESIQPNGLPNVRFVDSITRSPNFARAVVSYGPNGIPGGPEDYTALDLARGQPWRLYTKDNITYPADADFRCLRPQEYTQDRVNAWSFTKILGEDPPSYIGVIDKGSDDMVIEF